MKLLVKALSTLALVLAIGGSALAQEYVKGEVIKVDAKQKKVTIKHEPLTNLDMPAMTMVFVVAEQTACSIRSKRVSRSSSLPTASTDASRSPTSSDPRPAPRVANQPAAAVRSGKNARHDEGAAQNVIQRFSFQSSGAERLRGISIGYLRAPTLTYAG